MKPTAHDALLAITLYALAYAAFSFVLVGIVLSLLCVDGAMQIAAWVGVGAGGVVGLFGWWYWREG